MRFATGFAFTLLLTPIGGGCSVEYDRITGAPAVHPEEVTPCGFERIEDSPFWGYACNPVFATTGEPWAQTILSTAFHVTEMMDHPFYQVWYAAVPDLDTLGDFGLGYAVSSNGTDWTPHSANPLLQEPESTAWDGSNMETIQVVWDPSSEQYVMIYLGYNLTGWHTFGLGVATSKNGHDWTRLDQNPVIDFMETESDAPRWCWPLGLTVHPTQGLTGYRAAKAPGSDKCEMYPIHAESLTRWSAGLTPSYAVGHEGEFDDEGFSSVAIAELDGVHYMFYIGFSDWVSNNGVRYSHNHQLGWATSDDGTHWSRGVLPHAQVNGADSGAGPIHLREHPTGLTTQVAAYAVGQRIHLWVTDEWEGAQGIGYYLFDPERARLEDAR